MNMKSLSGYAIKRVSELKYVGSYIDLTQYDVSVRIGIAWL